MDFSYLKHLTQGYDKNQILHDLMVAYGQDVWNFAYSLSHQRHVADDIQQDVFVKAYDKLATFRGKSSVKTWLLAITRNAVIDYRRLAFIRRVILVDYILEKGSSRSAEKQFLDNLEMNNAWKAVICLPIKLREVLVLYAHNQLSITEISNVLQLSETTVKVRLNRARKKANEIYQRGEDC